MTDRLTLRERLENLRYVYGTKRIRVPKVWTAVGWKPDDSFTRRLFRTASGEREYSKPVKKVKP